MTCALDICMEDDMDNKKTNETEYCECHDRPMELCTDRDFAYHEDAYHSEPDFEE